MTTTKGARLDRVFAEIDQINATLAPYDEELHRIDHTPTGRFRTRLTPTQQARRDAIDTATANLRARHRTLTSRACRIAAE